MAEATAEIESKPESKPKQKTELFIVPIFNFRYTIRDNWTRGKPNSEVPHAERIPGYYLYAESLAEAQAEAERRHGASVDVRPIETQSAPETENAEDREAIVCA